ncbi:MAG: hypothetical protein IJP65_08490 [Bacteroidales bacterium]|nr:hypothetical protein [Bacteroidales bacterium]
MHTISATLICKKLGKEIATVATIATHATIIRTVQDVTIVIIAILVIIVTLVGRMKKNIHLIIILTSGILILCFAFPLLSKKNINLNMGLLIAIATLAVTCISLLFQRSGLITQNRLSVFSDSMHLLMADEKFSESQDYIFSRIYDEDITLVQRILKKNSQDDVDLDDFRRILHQNRKDGEVVDVAPDIRERLRISYNKIRYFFSRMEYLGVVSEEKGVETLILEYYGYTIISTYERLLPIIKKTRESPTSHMLYSHYNNLYKLAKKKRFLVSILNFLTIKNNKK